MRIERISELDSFNCPLPLEIAATGQSNWQEIYLLEVQLEHTKQNLNKHEILKRFAIIFNRLWKDSSGDTKNMFIIDLVMYF